MQSNAAATMTAIPNLEAHSKHIGYTMTLAAAGFAFTDAKYDDGSKLFGIAKLGAVEASLVTNTLLGVALALFLLALLLGVAAIFGMTGISQLSSHKDGLEAKIKSLQLERQFSQEEATEEELEAVKSLAETTASLKNFASDLAKRSGRHLWALILGFIIAAFLFLDSKVDADPAPMKCELSVNSDGGLLVPAACIAKKE